MERFSYKNIVIVFLGALAIPSCGVQKIEKVDELAIIKEHFTQKDVGSLIKDLSIYPAYRDEAEEYLFNGINYSTYKYDAITQFDKIAQEDFKAAAYFDSLKLSIQTDALYQLSRLDIEGAGNYYKQHADLRGFVRPYLIEEYFTNLYTLDYKTLKSLYMSFKDTDLSYYISRPYNTLRDSLLCEISSALDKYFTSEKELLENIEYTIRVDADQYVMNGTELIMAGLIEKNSRTLMQRIFYREDQDRYSFSGYASHLINEHFKPAYITDKVESSISEYIQSSNEYRENIFSRYFSIVDTGIYISPEQPEHYLIWEIGKSHINNVEDIKFTGAALSVGSVAIGLVSGLGAVALAADIADLAYGLTQDSKIDSVMIKLTDALYEDSLDCIENYLREYFDSIAMQREQSELALRRMFNENF